VWVLTLLAGLAGGMIPAFSKVSLETMNAGTLTILRYVYTFVALVAFVYLSGRRVNWRQVSLVLPVSVLAAINAICFPMAVQYVDPASVQLLYTIVPLIVVVLSWLVLKQRTGLGKLLGVFIGLVGVVVVTLAPLFIQGGTVVFHPVGVALVFTGAGAYSLYTVLSKPAQETASPSDMLLGTAIATLVCQAAYSMITSTPVSFAGISPRSLLASIIVGLIGTAFFYWVYQYIVKISSPLMASVILYVQPLFGALVAYMLLGAGLTLYALLGGALALAGVAQVNGVWNRLLARLRTPELESKP
jgi:drug/metabolite transporter (DMT)-like permease